MHSIFFTQGKNKKHVALTKAQLYVCTDREDQCYIESTTNHLKTLLLKALALLNYLRALMITISNVQSVYDVSSFVEKSQS
jgi:hypothetical protein